MTKEEFINKYLIIYRQDKWKDGTYEKAIESLKLVISESIAEHDAKQWEKYPDERPEIGEICLIQTNINKSILIAEYKGGLWVSNGIGYRYEVIAFRELPAPYQEGCEG